MIGLNAAKAARWMGGKIVGNPDAALSGVARIDSRLVEAGDLFFALPGEKVDGHDFLPKALAAGATAAVVTQLREDWQQFLSPEQALIIVDDGIKALQTCAKAYRQELSLPVIAVTGSTGKTSTKDLLASALSCSFDVMKNPGNFNNEIGLPLTVLSVQAHHQILIVEMGMRGPGQIEALCQIAQPVVGVLTNIGPVHMELLGSMEAIAQAKGELLQSLPEEGIAVVNGEDFLAVEQSVRQAQRSIYYGTCQKNLTLTLTKAIPPSSDKRVEVVWAKDIKPLGEKGSKVSANVGLFHIGSGEWHLKEAIDFHLPLPGRHQAANALASLAVAWGLEADLTAVAQGLTNAQLSSLRWETCQLKDNMTMINDAYNANPAAMKAALTTAVEIAAARRTVAILGDMYELGEEAGRFHEEVGAYAAQAGVGLLITVGPLGSQIAEGARSAGMVDGAVLHFDEVEKAAEAVRGLLGSGDVILIKASRGMRLERLASALSDGLR
ncbi:UDP-N-acetylmuramoyl-tripeptide--D-alanyl-D-alanine ligase [Heliobacterium chlorum]|uniref:UDP-N-acetylmuramoyl-tripeptide--D-alanyl-D-alanine ligase n=1 Tax=Heliobacterium chlorum TaxID=2698 RepID=A0ABR7T060_HELCL|nr:UDP-N-acetylmuramoyl-tripeptide--D-alanyl-D-alanine ligase [Heliobacterium chlorum]MBC9783249.1 UDP-N-acetylmuramoyl-tripeptide--D-alanyl-D-alanine ligase [Heliobacterium chlorum]